MNDLLPLWAIPALALLLAVLWAPQIFHYLRAHKAWTRPWGIVLIGAVELLGLSLGWGWINEQDAKLMSTLLPLLLAAPPAYFLWVFRNADKQVDQAQKARELSQRDFDIHRSIFMRACVELKSDQDTEMRRGARTLLKMFLSKEQYGEVQADAENELREVFSDWTAQASRLPGTIEDRFKKAPTVIRFLAQIILEENTSRFAVILKQLDIRFCLFEGEAYSEVSLQEFESNVLSRNRFKDIYFEKCSIREINHNFEVHGCDFVGCTLKGKIRKLEGAGIEFSECTLLLDSLGGIMKDVTFAYCTINRLKLHGTWEGAKFVETKGYVIFKGHRMPSYIDAPELRVIEYH